MQLVNCFIAGGDLYLGVGKTWFDPFDGIGGEGESHPRGVAELTHHVYRLVNTIKLNVAYTQRFSFIKLTTIGLFLRDIKIHDGRYPIFWMDLYRIWRISSLGARKRISGRSDVLQRPDIEFDIQPRPGYLVEHWIFDLISNLKGYWIWYPVPSYSKYI